MIPESVTHWLFLQVTFVKKQDGGGFGEGVEQLNF